MTDELLPCPFCGHDVEWHTNDFDGDSSLTVFIECPNEDCSLYQMRGDNTFESVSEAVEAWNRRPNIDARIAAAVAAEREACAITAETARTGNRPTQHGELFNFGCNCAARAIRARTEQPGNGDTTQGGG